MFRSRTRSSLALAFVAGVGLAGSLPALHSAEFEASGTWAFTSKAGSQFEGVMEGKARPGGKFTADFTQFGAGLFARDGIATMTFPSGSLTIAYEAQHDIHDRRILTGIYVIVGGTGHFERATGGGDLLIGDDGVQGIFMMLGTIDL